MSAQDTIGISIKIMGKQHQFACPTEQAKDFKQAANNLAALCDDIKSNSSIASSERALLVASINLSYSLLMANNQLEHDSKSQMALIASLKKAL